MIRFSLLQMKVGTALLVCALLIFGLGMSSPVYADSPLVTVTVGAGPLAEASVPITFAATLGGTTTYLLPITVADLTGNTNGWNLTITSTQFISLDTLHTLPTNASTITSILATCVTVTGCISLSLANEVSTLPDIPAGIVPPTPVKFFSISSGGLGIYTVTPTVTVTVPAIAAIGTYTSILSLAVASGP